MHFNVTIQGHWKPKHIWVSGLENVAAIREWLHGSISMSIHIIIVAEKWETAED